MLPLYSKLFLRRFRDEINGTKYIRINNRQSIIITIDLTNNASQNIN